MKSRLILSVLGSWVVASCAFAAVEKKPVVFTLNAEVTELSETLAYPARVEPRIRASIVSETDGVVTKIIAPLGSHVRARAPLLIVKNTDPIYNYSAMIVESAVDGVVSKVEVTEGSRVARGDKLLLVTDPEQVRVSVEVTAYDLALIRPGQMAELKTPGSELVVPLKVKGVSPFVDPVTGTATCELELGRITGKPAAHMPPLGIIGRVYFRANVRKGISVPDSAITYRGKDPYLRLVENGKAKLVAIAIGRKEAGLVEILKGLKAGDQFIERASGFVADGEAVDVQSTGQKKNDAAQPAPKG
jgi:multidrug efflux pump subunit AcrA (membrane-fusion protein)